jgi:hypothetical protein
MGATLARAEVALFLSMMGAANGYMQATLRYAGSIDNDAVLSSVGSNRMDRPGLDPSAPARYRAYLRELAGVTRVSAVSFVEAFDSLRPARPK